MLKRVCLLMAMIWSLGFICTADAAPMELGLKPVVLGNEYSISLFMDDKVLPPLCSATRGRILWERFAKARF